MLRSTTCRPWFRTDIGSQPASPRVTQLAIKGECGGGHKASLGAVLGQHILCALHGGWVLYFTKVSPNDTYQFWMELHFCCSNSIKSSARSQADNTPLLELKFLRLYFGVVLFSTAGHYYCSEPRRAENLATYSFNHFVFRIEKQTV